MKHAGLAATLVGIVTGLGAYTFVYARGASYLTTDPAACANCHIMADHYSAWLKSSHRQAAGCSDCHMPHDLVGKYTIKALNGFWHSLAFTTGRYPDPLLIKPYNRDVVEEACRDCHATITDAINAEHYAPADGDVAVRRPQLHDGIAVNGDQLLCTRCHAEVGHRVR